MQGQERQDHLLACLTEECGEVSQLVGKCLRFGLNDSHPKTGNVPNIELLEKEFNEVIAVGEMLGLKCSSKLIEEKKQRVLEYIEYAKISKLKG